MTPEDLYKNSFDGYQQDPPPGVWDRVNRQLATKSFLTPGLGHFNILYVAAAAAIVVAVFWASPDENQAPTQNGEDVTMADSPRINIRILLNKLSIENQFSKFTQTGKEPAVSHRLLAYTKHELELSKRSHTPFDIHLLKKNIQKKSSPPFHV